MAVSGGSSSSSLQSPVEHAEQFSGCLAHQFTKPEPPSSCDSFLRPLHHHPFLSDFGDPTVLQECWDSSQPTSVAPHVLVASGPVTTGVAVAENRLSARRILKADREKLRRDKLNEQFSELASALDPDRPKNDKATILSESVQVVKDLREEVKRLKTEHTALMDESRDLTQEKSELREEKAALKNETEQLQSQIQQRLHAPSPWMGMDPSVLMGAATFPYPPVPIQQSILASQTDAHPARPMLAPPPYLPMATPLGGFHVHPSLQPLPMFGSRPCEGGGGNPFLPFPAFPGQPVTPHSHVERPYAQYPPLVQPGYVVQVPPNSALDSHSSSRSSSAYKACVPGIPVVTMAPNHGQDTTKTNRHHASPSRSSSQHNTRKESKQEMPGSREPTDDLPNSGNSTAQGTVNVTTIDDINDEEVEASQHISSNLSAAGPVFVCEKADMPTDRGSLVDMGPLISHRGEVQDDPHDASLTPPAA